MVKEFRIKELLFKSEKETAQGMEHLNKRKPNLLFFWFLLPFVHYLKISPDLICGHCCFEKNQDKKARTETLIAGIREGRKKNLYRNILKH